MTGPAKKNRIEHFIAAYEPLDGKTESLIWDRVHRGGWGLDDPASIQIAHDTIMEARMTTHLALVAQLPDQIAKATIDSVSSIQAFQAREKSSYAKRIAHHIASETRDGLVKIIPMLETELATGARLRLRRWQLWRAFGMLLTIAFVGYGSYVMGRTETSGNASEFAELATRTDAPAWLELLRANRHIDLLIAEFCVPGQPNYFHHTDGRAACNFSLFLEETSPPASVGYLKLAGDFLVSTWANASNEVLTFFGHLGAAKSVQDPWNT
ncbi:MAG: hypothetical protein ABJL57_00590 [Hyphomonas sp.]|uniref:hypothetical protein n=1 Tax=Alphaproteobacteria TaxID=28211 RepID=UPI0032990F09